MANFLSNRVDSGLIDSGMGDDMRERVTRILGEMKPWQAIARALSKRGYEFSSVSVRNAVEGKTLNPGKRKSQAGAEKVPIDLLNEILDVLLKGEVVGIGKSNVDFPPFRVKSINIRTDDEGSDEGEPMPIFVPELDLESPIWAWKLDDDSMRDDSKLPGHDFREGHLIALTEDPSIQVSPGLLVQVFDGTRHHIRIVAGPPKNRRFVPIAGVAFESFSDKEAEIKGKAVMHVYNDDAKGRIYAVYSKGLKYFLK